MPGIRSQHTTELYLNLEDAEDNSIPGYSEAEILKLLKASGDNSVTSVTRLYPKNIVREADYHKYNGMKLCIEFENFTPSRVYFQNVSLPIKDYIMPAKRCFACQRRGHSSITCSRKQACCDCARDHAEDRCTVTDPKDFKWTHCQGNHNFTRHLQCIAHGSLNPSK